MQEDHIQKLEKVVQEIQLRNKRVEADKAWETSNFRKAIILVLTYVVIVLFMFAAKVANAWINAIVPSLGFFLSTLTIPFIKRWWVKRHHI